MEQLEAYFKEETRENFATNINSIQSRDIINDFTKKHIYLLRFSEFLNELLQECNEETRFRWIKAITKLLDPMNLSHDQTSEILGAITGNLHRLLSSDLVQLCRICIESLRKGKITDLYWKDLLPNVLHAVTEHRTVEYEDVNISGVECKKRLIGEITQIEWSTNIVTSLTDMFCWSQLNDEEHKTLVKKLCQYIDKLTAQELPGFVYQLLEFCRDRNGRAIFINLYKYFNVNLYINETVTNPDSDNTDIIESAMTLEIKQAESTILYHINACGRSSNHIIGDYLKFATQLTKTPEFILHPFQMNVLLSLLDVPTYKERILKIVQPALVQTIRERQKRAGSAWLRELAPDTRDLAVVMSSLVANSVEDRDSVIKGLVYLAFDLLSATKAFGRETIARELWQLGKQIIIKLIKLKNNLCGEILRRFNVLSESTGEQHVDCIRALFKHFPMCMLEHQARTMDLMEKLMFLPDYTGQQVLDALAPLVKVSTTLRDRLVLVLKKALFSCAPHTHKIAVIGFLQLIKDIKLTDVARLSQSRIESSGSSILSQLSVAYYNPTVTSSQQVRQYSNEALCFEVIGLLRRCFQQSVEKKIVFYDSVCDAVLKNGMLSIPVLKLLWNHFFTYVNYGDDKLALDLSKIVQIRGVDVIQQEGLGRLIHNIVLMSCHALDIDEYNDDERKQINQLFLKPLRDITTRMENSQLEQFEIDDGTDLLDMLPESQAKLIVLKELLSVYEALIEFNVLYWSEKSAASIKHLFGVYNQLGDFGKSLKGRNKSKKAKDDAAGGGGGGKSTQNTTHTNANGGAGKNVFKANDCLLSLKALIKLMELLHLPDVELDNADLLKSNVFFHQFTLRSILTTITALQRAKYFPRDHKHDIYESIEAISKITYQRCIDRLADFLDFDEHTAILALETFHAALELVHANFNHQWMRFLCNVADKTKRDDYVVFEVYLKHYQRLLDKFDELSVMENETAHVRGVILGTLKLLAGQLPAESLQSNDMLNWLKQYTLKDIQLDKKNVSFVFAFMFEQQIKNKTSLNLMKNTVSQIGDLVGYINDEEDLNTQSNDAKYQMINDGNCWSVLGNVANSLKTLLDECDWIIMRLNGEWLLSYKNAADKQRNLCCHLCQIISINSILSNFALQSNNSEAIIKINTLLFNRLTNLTKYFAKIVTEDVNLQTARFDIVVKSVGKTLSPLLYKQILYIEKNDENEGKKKGKAKGGEHHIPKLIYEMECFNKYVMRLSKSAKVNLDKYIGLGTARDFRILNTKPTNNNDDDNEEEENRSNHDTTVESVGSSSHDENVMSDDEDEAPRRKRSKYF